MRIHYATSATADQSQYGQTLTASGVGGYLDPSAETAIDGSGAGREVTVYFEATTSSAGTLIYHGSTGGTIGFKIHLTASSSLAFIDSSGTLATITIPSLVALPARNCMVSWNTRPNPLTTGAGDAHTSEFFVANIDTGEWDMSQVDHAVGTISASDVFSYAGQWNGATLTNSITIEQARVGGRFKSTTEIAVDFSAYTPAAATTGENQAAPMLLMPAASQLGDGGKVAGPAYQIASAQVRDCARRLSGTLVNWYSNYAERQGQTHKLRTTLNSRDEVWLIQGTEPGAAEPGHTDGVSGAPEIARHFDSANSECFEEETGSHPGFISDLQGSSEFTISGWVKLDSIAGNMVLCGLTGGGGSSGALNDCAVVTVLSSGLLDFSGHYGTGSTAISCRGVTVLTTDTWYHWAVTGTDNGGTAYDLELFLDGVSDATVTAAPYPTHGSSSTWQVGRRDNNGTYSEYLDGAQAEIKIANAVMTDAEIADEAARGQGYLLQRDELAHWQFRRPSNGYMPARAFLQVDLGGNAYMAHLDTLVKRPLHRMCGKFEARVKATRWFTQPPGTSETVDAASIAIVATNRQPGKVVFGGPPEKLVYSTASMADTEALETHEFTNLSLPRDDDDCCWFYLATRINSNSPTGHTGVSFSGLQITQYSADADSSYPIQWAEP